MALRIYDPRVLAIDLRFHRSGFAIYEGPRRLLDYGTTVVFSETAIDHTKAFLELLKVSLPSVVVLRRERWENTIARPETRQLARVLIKECTARQIEIRLLEHKAIRSTFRALDCETKREISSALSRFFPNLIWQLPPERRVWESEHPSQRVFDAIALGFAYWQQLTRPIASQTEEKGNHASS